MTVYPFSYHNIVHKYPLSVFKMIMDVFGVTQCHVPFMFNFDFKHSGLNLVSRTTHAHPSGKHDLTGKTINNVNNKSPVCKFINSIKNNPCLIIQWVDLVGFCDTYLKVAYFIILNDLEFHYKKFYSAMAFQSCTIKTGLVTITYNHVT